MCHWNGIEIHNLTPTSLKSYACMTHSEMEFLFHFRAHIRVHTHTSIHTECTHNQYLCHYTAICRLHFHVKLKKQNKVLDSNTSWLATNHSVTQEISKNVWKPEVFSVNHYISPRVSVRNQFNHYLSPHFISLRSALILLSILRLSFHSDLFPSDFSINILHKFLFTAMRVTWPLHLIRLDIVFPVILVDEYKSWSSSLCSFRRLSIASCLFIV
jgi:hypothetical protein